MSGLASSQGTGQRWSTGGLWYQFITTGPEITSYSGETFSVYKGSAVAVKLPKIKTDGSVVWDNVTPIATGSSLEILPDETPIAESTAEIQRIHSVVQVQLISEPSYRFYAHIDQSNSYKQYKQLIHSWSSMPGVIYNAGIFMLSPSFELTDKAYDAPPTTINSKHLKIHEPDMDWPHDAAILRVTSEEFGSRSFIVAVDASSRFYCWPYLLDEDVDLGSPYSSQGQKVTVPDERARSLDAPFPSWVHVPVGDRRDTDWPSSVNSGEPRYVWRFHPQGTKVVGLVLQRETFTGTVYGQTLSNPSYLKFTQVEVDDVQLKYGTPSTAPFTRNGVSGNHDIKNDTPGYVEFSIDIVLTGLEEDNFTFDLTLLREQQSDATHYPIAADYLSPVLGGWETYNINGQPGDLVILDLAAYTDERERTWINRFCGFSQRTDEYVRQTWARVLNKENNQILISFLIKDQPEEFSRKTWDSLRLEHETYQGKLSSIDLSKLSFIYEVVKNQYFYDETPYFIDPTNGANANIYQRRRKEEQGIRFYVMGKKVKEQQNGENLLLWNSLDEMVLFESAIRFDPLELHTRWLKTNNSSGDHWLFGFSYGLDCFYPRNTTFTTYAHEGLFDGALVYSDHIQGNFEINFGNEVIASDTELADSFLRSLSSLDSDTSSGRSYSYPTYIQVSETNTHTTVDDPGGLDPILWIIEYSHYVDTSQTPILEKMAANCLTCDINYFDNILVPWAKEVRDLYTGQITDINYFDVPIGWQWEDPNTPEYDLTYFHEHDSLTVGNATWISDNERRYSPALEIFRSQEHEMDIYLKTYTTTNKFQRIYNYPIGKELMLREWTKSIKNNSLPTLMTTPEGFYAGTVIDHPYISNSIPDGQVFISPTSSKMYINIYPTYDSRSNAHYSQINQPNENQFSFFTVDQIGHVKTSTNPLTHETCYETAFQHSLSLPVPEIRIRIGTIFGSLTYHDYIYEKKYIKNGTTYWQPFFDDVNSDLYKPILNGSMLFSK